MDTINYILIEAYCLKHVCEDSQFPSFCPLIEKSQGVPTYQCLANHCPHLDFTSCENALCFVNNHSEMGYGIMIGREVTEKQQEFWEQISRKKIDEAYDELNYRTEGRSAN